MCDVSLPASWTSVQLFDGEYYVYRAGSGPATSDVAGTYTHKASEAGGRKGSGGGTKANAGSGGGGGKQPHRQLSDDDNSNNSNNSSSASSPQPRKAAMEGPVYVCDYLGYKTLPKPATNIAALQSPVKDLYLQFRKTMQQGGPPKKSSFRVTQGGLLVSLHESGGTVDMFFDIAAVNLMEVVRFAVLKGSSEKKPKAIFMPLDDRGGAGPVSDKAAFHVDKAFHFLVQATHQPLLVCVLRRPKGVKALDCHLFAMDSVEAALHVQNLVAQIAAGGPISGIAAGGGGDGSGGNFNRGVTRGDFIRTDFGDYNVYRGGGGGGGGGGGSGQAQAQAFELKDEHFRGGGGGGGGGSGGGVGGGYPPGLELGPRGGGQPSPRETYPAESGERPRFGWSYDKPQQPPPQHHHHLQGADEFRRGGGPSYGGEAPLPHTPRPASGAEQYYGDRGAQYPGDRRSGGGGGGGGGASAEMGVMPSRGGSAYDGGGGGGKGAPPPGHARERSGDSGDHRVTGLSRNVSGSSSDHRRYDDAGGIGNRGGSGYGDYAPPLSRGGSGYGGPVSPRGEGPPKVMDKPVSPARVVPGPQASSYPIPDSPRSPQPPLSAHRPISPSPFEGPACSLSNRESRDDAVGGVPGGGGGAGAGADEPSAHQGGKPVAKVPPHLKGVKVLPSDFLAVKLKPKQPAREPEDSGDHGYDNHKNVLAQYKQLQLQEQEALMKGGGGVHKDQGGGGGGFTPFNERDLEKPFAQRSYSENWNDDGYGGGGGGGVGGDQYRRYDPDERRYIEQYSGDQDGKAQMRPYGQAGYPRREDSPGPAGKNRYSSPDYAAESNNNNNGHASQNSGGGGANQWRSHSAYSMGAASSSAGQGYNRGGAPAGGGRGTPVMQARGNGAPSSTATDDKQMGRKKDAEIASMFSNVRVQGREEDYRAERNNFEESLGYLP